MAILRVNVIFENSSLGVFTTGSFWKTWDQLGDINSPLLKTLVNESYSVGIGYWSNCSQRFAVTIFPSDPYPVMGLRSTWYSPRPGILRWNYTLSLQSTPLFLRSIRLLSESLWPPLCSHLPLQEWHQTHVHKLRNAVTHSLQPSCCAAYKTNVCPKYSSIFFLSAPPPWQVSSVLLFSLVYAYILPFSAYQQKMIFFSHS